MGQILAIVSSKGGVGKTTTAVNLAAAFASFSFPTLLVEADPQCSIMANFGFDRFEIPLGLSDVARGNAALEDTTYETPVPALHLVSSNVWTREEEALYMAALELDPMVLRRAMESLKDSYDYIIIDAPPMTGPITMAVLAAADRFVVPVQAEPHSARSLSRLLESANQVRTRLNPNLTFDGVAITMFDSRTRMSETVSAEVRNGYPEKVFSSTIPRHVRLAEIPQSGRPLVVAAPASRGARAYSALAEEILLMHARERMMDRSNREIEEPKGPGSGEDFRPDLAGKVLEGKTLETVSANLYEPDSSRKETAVAEEEWDNRFVDIETFLKMESGDQDARKNTDDAWEEDWDSWSRDD